MSKTAKTALYTVVLFAAVVCLVFAAKEFNADFSSRISGAYLAESPDTATVFTCNAVNVDWLSGSVIVKPCGGKSISYSVDAGSVRASFRGGTLYLSSESGSGDLVLYLPVSRFSFSCGSLAVKTAAGKVKIGSIALHQLSIESSGGDISVEQAEIYEISIKSRSGRASFDKITCTVLQADMDGGDFSAYGNIGECYLDMLYGNVSFEALSDIIRADISVINGNITCSVPNYDVTLFVTNFSGAFKCNRDLAYDGVCYTSGGGDVPITLSTDAGDITVKLR